MSSEKGKFLHLFFMSLTTYYESPSPKLINREAATGGVL